MIIQTKNQTNKNIHFLKNHIEIKKILKKYKIENYTIRNDGIIDIDGDVNLNRLNFEYFPIEFGNVNGDFYCSFCKNLKSLKGSPKKCKSFNVQNCENLKTLEGAPKECKSFNCSFCHNLGTLNGAPKKCESFICHECDNLFILDGVPKICKIFSCFGCKNLKSLKGAPEKCKSFDCSWCKNLKSLKGAPKKCESFWCSDCEQLHYSLKYFPKCKNIGIETLFNTPFERLYSKIGKDLFIKLTSIKTESDFENTLAIIYALGDFDFKVDIRPLLSNKKITSKEFKNKYRGIIAGEKYIF